MLGTIVCCLVVPHGDIYRAPQELLGFSSGRQRLGTAFCREGRKQRVLGGLCLLVSLKACPYGRLPWPVGSGSHARVPKFTSSHRVYYRMRYRTPPDSVCPLVLMSPRGGDRLVPVPLKSPPTRVSFATACGFATEKHGVAPQTCCVPQMRSFSCWASGECSGDLGAATPVTMATHPPPLRAASPCGVQPRSRVSALNTLLVWA